MGRAFRLHGGVGYLAAILCGVGAVAGPHGDSTPASGALTALSGVAIRTNGWRLRQGAIPPAPSAARAPTLRTVRVGVRPIAVAVDARTQRVFVVNGGPRMTNSLLPSGPGSVTTLDAMTGRRLRTVMVDWDPTGVAVDARSGRVFVVSRGRPPRGRTTSLQGSVSVLDATTGRLLRTVLVGAGGGYTIPALIVDACSGRVFVPDPTGSIHMLDATTGRLLRTILAGGNPQAVAVDARSGRVFVANGLGSGVVPNTDGSVNVLDATTGALRSTVPLDLPTYAVAVDERAGRVFVDVENDADRSNNVRVLDATTGRPRQSIDGAGGETLVTDPTAGRVLAVDSTTFILTGSYVGLTVLDSRSGRVVNRATLEAEGGYAAAIAVDERTGHSFLASAQQQFTSLSFLRTTVYVIDTRRGQVLRHFTVGTGPPAVAVDAQAGQVYVANGGDNTMSILDAARL